MKILELGFDSAKAFYFGIDKDNFRDKGYLYSHALTRVVKEDNHKERLQNTTCVSSLKYNRYIDMHTMINVLHALIDLPTVSRHRDKHYIKHRKYDEECKSIAKTANIIIDNEIAEYTFTFNKFKSNSWRKETIVNPYKNRSEYEGTTFSCGILTWFRVKSYMMEEQYSQFRELVDFYSEKEGIKNISVLKAFVLLNKYMEKDKKIQNLAQYFLANGKKPLHTLLAHPETMSKDDCIISNEKNPYPSLLGFHSASNKFVKRMVTTYPRTVRVINGTIKLKVEDSFIQRLKDGPGCATLLEDGVVYIKSIKNLKEDFEPTICPTLKTTNYIEHLNAINDLIKKEKEEKLSRRKSNVPKR